MGLTEILLTSLLTLSTAFNIKKCNVETKITNIPIVPSIDIITNREGGLDHNNTNKVLGLVGDLRTSEQYYHKTIEKFNGESYE